MPLNATALEVLRRQLGKHRVRVFTYAGKPLGSANTLAWRKALKRAGIENFRWHDLRHTWASWHRQAGTPTHELQRLGGWRSSMMVERYAHLAPDHLARAANQLDSLSGGYGLVPAVGIEPTINGLQISCSASPSTCISLAIALMAASKIRANLDHDDALKAVTDAAMAAKNVRVAFLAITSIRANAMRDEAARKAIEELNRAAVHAPSK